MSLKEIKFLKSALTEENPFNTTDEILKWVERKSENIDLKIEQIKFSDMNEWHFDPEKDNLVHRTGKFFSIDGINIKTNWGDISEWEQPIINQPEIGFLGIIAKEMNGILYFLLQAKIEPGNIRKVSLSPTLQATRSNYTQVHKGRKPHYLDYFTSNKNTDILLDQLQSEQGARFLKKRNRNIIIEVKEDIAVHEDFCWLTIGQIKKLLQVDNLINMDTRTVISCIPYGDFGMEIIDLLSVLTDSYLKWHKLKPELLLSMINNGNGLHSTDMLISWITKLKSKYQLDVTKIPLHSIKDWIFEENRIYHKEEKYFSIIAVSVEVGNREIRSWTQPLVKAAQDGVIAFIIKNIGGVYHFLVQAKLEAGNHDIFELAPTVQCITGNYRDVVTDKRPPFLNYVLQAKDEHVIYSAYQSEEGGRFYKVQNKNLIIEAEEGFPIDVPENYAWMTLNQLQRFIGYNNFLNVESRSLIACVDFA